MLEGPHQDISSTWNKALLSDNKDKEESLEPEIDEEQKKREDAYIVG
jgi:hypothetical protein